MHIKVLCVAFLAVVDIFLTIVLYSHGFHKFDTYPGYSFSTNFFDLCLLGILRGTIIIGGSIGLLCNPKDGQQRLIKSQPFINAIAGSIIFYAGIKLILYSMKVPDMSHHVWFWTLFSWTIFGSILLYVFWNLLQIAAKTPRNNIKLLVINSDTNPHTSLIEENGTEEDDVSSSSSDSSSSDKDTEEGSKASLLRLFSYSKPDLPIIVIAFVALVGASVAEIYLPFYTGEVINGIVVDGNVSEFTNAIIIMAVISFAGAIASGIRGGLFKVAMARLNIRVRNLLFSSITKQDIGFFDLTNTGDITSRLTSDTSTMSDTVCLNLNIFLRSTVKIAGFTVMMIRLSWRLTLITLLAIPIIALVSEIYGKYYKKLSKAVQDSLAVANNVAEEVISSMKTVRSFASEKQENERYANKLKKTYKINLKEALAYSGYMLTNEMFDLSITVVTLYLGGHLVIDGYLKAGNLVSFILYQIELAFAFEDISNVYTGLMQAAGAAEKVFEMLDNVPDRDIYKEGCTSDELKGHIEFKNVSFAYPTRKDAKILQDVSFEVTAGDVVALVGSSGSGKSSCVSLIECFYQSLEGEVLLDGVPVQDYDHSFLHSKISMVGQEPVLFDRSIGENIRYAYSDHDFEEVKLAAQLANAHKFITDLKQGYETQTGEKGTQLSGGQKQRVAIARALIRKPKVMLLDEATSALDAESEHVVQQAIYGHAKDTTILIIAHRLSTVENADKIIVMENGKVAEQGTHNQLLKLDGKYSKLVQRQLMGVQSKTDDDDEENG
ncbi:ABC-type oligopeptide transporter ABCB9-like [Antedon mediterranea]|uniref:ABC-type oligopeptide transporter ABCB9-like n=1 Tax=Antedon mediterranea TaxID=105859 RepID=UPI003AF5A13D